jgi:tRNA(Ile)-lysidine synthase
MRRKAFAARVWPRLKEAERAFSASDRVLAAVSGGPDSVCLAHWLAGAARRKGFKLFLLHVHHGLRGRSADADARFVQKLGLKLGLPVSVVRVKAAERAAAKKTGLEDAARELRYKALKDRCRRLRCNKAAVGHQRDDQAETLLLHLLRGTRLEGLGGMAPSRPLAPGLELVRPLLGLSRAEVLAYLHVHGLESRRDKSNEDTRLSRNWIRLKLLPLLEKRSPGLSIRLAGLTAQVRRLTKSDK